MAHRLASQGDTALELEHIGYLDNAATEHGIDSDLSALEGY